jgi:hypothetical protein
MARTRIVFAVLLLFTVGLVAVGGFGALGHRHADHVGCPAALAKTWPCPSDVGTADFFAFHLGALRSFAAATSLATQAASLLIAALLMAYGFAAARRGGTSPLRCSALLAPLGWPGGCSALNFVPSASA